LRQLVSGYLDICQRGIVHRDLKPANIFFRDGVLKIADFGFAVKIDKCARPFSYNLGSPSYMAPEALRDNRYSFKSDIWALGVIAYESLHGKVPWRSENDVTLLRMLMNEPIEKYISQ
jgi:serine/threonine protein kinase